MFIFSRKKGLTAEESTVASLIHITTNGLCCSRKLASMTCHYHTVVYDVAKEVNYLPLCVLSNRIINENSIDDDRKY